LQKPSKYETSRIQYGDRMQRKRLSKVFKQYNRMTEGPGGDLRRYSWMNEVETGQQVAQLHEVDK
jgi:hypothetical protein